MSPTALSILRQFSAYRGLRQVATDICLWAVYSSVIHRRTLDFGIVYNLLLRLDKLLDDKLAEQLVNAFWTSAESFISGALNAVRHVRNNPDIGSNPANMTYLLQ